MALAYHRHVTRSAAPERTARGLVVAAVGCVVASRELWSASRLLPALVAMQVAVHGAMWLSGSTRAVDARLAAYVERGSSHAHGDAGRMTAGMLRPSLNHRGPPVLLASR